MIACAGTYDGPRYDSLGLTSGRPLKDALLLVIKVWVSRK
jgi:hypothetical protein